MFGIPGIDWILVSAGKVTSSGQSALLVFLHSVSSWIQGGNKFTISYSATAEGRDGMDRMFIKERQHINHGDSAALSGSDSWPL